MKRLVLSLLLVTSCTLHDPALELPPPPVPVVAPAPAPEPAQVTQIVYVPMPETPAPARAPVEDGAKIKARGPAGKPASSPNPTRLIEEANRAARLAPSPRGYFGGGDVHRYQWTPGRIYDVYLSPTSGTKIILPPGEVLAHELILNPDAFDVSQVTIGTELRKNTIILIRPCAESEHSCKPATSADVALISESGRPYDLHLIVGKIGMVGVTWAIAPVVEIQMDDAPPPRDK